jgi:hypothetical protein
MRGVLPTRNLEADRECIALRNRGLTWLQIGKATGVTQERARQRWLRAMRLLRDYQPPPVAHLGRVDATQPDDPPRGEWIGEK